MKKIREEVIERPRTSYRDTHRTYSDGRRFLRVSISTQIDSGAVNSREVCWEAPWEDLEENSGFRDNRRGPALVINIVGKRLHVEYYVNNVPHRLEGPAKTSRANGSKVNDLERYFVGGEEITKQMFLDVTRCLVDPDFAMKNVSDPILKYPASRCLGDELTP